LLKSYSFKEITFPIVKMHPSVEVPSINPLLKNQYLMLSELLAKTNDQSPKLRSLSAALHYLTFRCQATTGMDFGMPDILENLLARYPLLAAYHTPDAAVPFDLERIEKEVVEFTEISLAAYSDSERQNMVEHGPGRWLLDYHRLKSQTSGK
jgi:hypothetical protein